MEIEPSMERDRRPLAAAYLCCTFSKRPMAFVCETQPGEDGALLWSRALTGEECGQGRSRPEALLFRAVPPRFRFAAELDERLCAPRRYRGIWADGPDEEREGRWGACIS